MRKEQKDCGGGRRGNPYMTIRFTSRSDEDEEKKKGEKRPQW
jgi:hypothetical protein